jgi:hypothetical protein
VSPEIAADAVPEDPRLAHIERVPRVVVIEVDARLFRQARNLGLEITDRHAVHFGVSTPDKNLSL